MSDEEPKAEVDPNYKTWEDDFGNKWTYNYGVYTRWNAIGGHEEKFSEETYLEARQKDRHAHMKVSDRIRARAKASGKPFFANDTVHEHIHTAQELREFKAEVEERVKDLLETLVIDHDNDHNTKETAKRVAKMYIDEVMKGRYHKPPSVTKFPNVKALEQIYTVGPVSIRSMCSHHFVPIIGQVFVGILPNKHLIGLSKFSRLADWIMSRPQIQEEAVMQLADALEEELDPMGLAIVFKAEHMCMCWRGVKDSGSKMTNSVMRGLFLANPSAKQEFFELIKGSGF